MQTEFSSPKALPFDRLLSPAEGAALGLDPELTWNWNQILLQDRFSGTPAGFPDKTARKKAIDAWNWQYIAYRRAHDHRLRSRPVSLPEHFVGREKELSAIRRLLDEQGRVVIHGMGGMGKTTLARAYAARFDGEYDAVLWLNFHQTLANTFCDDGELAIENLAWNAGQYHTQAEYFRRKWKVLCRLLAGQKVLLILDDMNQLRDRHFPLLWKLPCHVLITSRVSSDDWPAAVFPLTPLQSEEEWQEFYRCYSRTAPDQEETRLLDAFRGRVHGNTLLMQLAARNPGQMSPDSMTDGSLPQYFLRGSLLEPADIRALRFLSLLPVNGIQLEIFLRASGTKKAALKKLQSMALVWIRGQEGISSCGLHPVIAESVRVCYPPTQENCRSFLKNMSAEYEDIWQSPYTAVTKAVPICRSLLTAWPAPQAWLSDCYDTFATVLWIGGYFSESLKHMLQLYQSCRAYYGEVHQITGSIALRVAAVYHNSMQFPKAREWYETGLTILRQSAPCSQLYYYHLAQAAHKMCRNDRHEGNYGSALAYSREAMDALNRYRQNGDPELSRTLYYFLELEKAKILLCQGNCQETEDICRRLFQEYQEQWGETRRYYLTELNLLLAETLLKQGQATQALKIARSCVETARAMRGETAKETLGCLEILADAQAASGESESARQLYRHILRQLTRYYPLQTRWYQEISDKEAAL